MLRKHLLTTVLLLLLFDLAAQQSDARLSFNYQGTSLDNALSDLEGRYALRFTYSSSRLPMDYMLYASVDDRPIEPAMGTLFEGTPIKHAIIGEQIVLRAAPGSLGQLQNRPAKPRQEAPLYEEKQRKPREAIVVPEQIPSRQLKEISGGDTWQSEIEEEDKAKMAEMIERHERELAMDAYNDTHRLGQISLLPYLGTNTHRSNEMTNQVSVNIFWGTSKAIDGFEIGGFGNTVVEDMRGLQIAGVFNMVGGDVTGTQLAGIVSSTKGKVTGAQVSGMVNIGRDSVIGAQVAGLYNIAGYHVNGAQVSGLFNTASGDVRYQVSGIYNKARFVSRRQAGLINVCDTTAKAPYGLLNFVKYGYNRIEVGSSEAMFVNLGAKLGVRQLYNILQFGLRWDLIDEIENGQTIRGSYTSWSLGYGLGIAHRLGKRSLLNTELLAQHVNEKQSWTNDLNLWGQFRMNFDYQLNRRWSVYFGPTVNMMWSNLYNENTGEYGSVVPLDPIWEQQSGKTNTKAWIGFTAGLRL
jgi:hypothetical protein